MEDKRTDKDADKIVASYNIVTTEADISDINKGRREKSSVDMVDERLPENNRNHQWKQNESEFMQQDEILNQERAASDNPGENALTTAIGNSLGNYSDNRRDNESVEGALNNPGVKVSGRGNVSILKYFNIEFYESEDGNRIIGCGASTEGTYTL